MSWVNYRQIFDKLPLSLVQELQRQTWSKPYLEQGKLYHELLSSSETMLQLKNRMTEAERRTLGLIVTEIGCNSFHIQELEKAASNRMTGAEVKVALAGLRGYGVVTVFRKSWGEQFYVLPEDGFEIWQKLLLQPFPADQRLRGDEWETVGSAMTASRGLAQDLFHMLVIAASGEITLTQKGTLHKKTILKLTDQLQLANFGDCKLPFTYACTEVYEPGLAILLDAAVRLGLLQREESSIKLHKDTLAEWLSLTFGQQQSRLYQLWKQNAFPAAPWLQHAISIMQTIPDFQWCSINEIAVWLGQNQVQMGGLTEGRLIGELLQQWVLLLEKFRWIELVKDDQYWFRWLISVDVSEMSGQATRTEEKGCLYIQPDFEILLPPTAPFLVEWEIAAFSQLTRSDQVRTYLITKQSFHRACDAGADWREWIDSLKKWSAYAVPDNVLHMLEQWGSQYGNVYFTEVALLRCLNKEMADLIVNNDKCKPFIQEKIGESSFIVSGDQIAEFRKLLEQMGAYPRRSLVKTETASNDKQCLSLQGWITSRDPIHIYELESSLHTLEDIYPDMQEIPALWLKEYRAYHASTKKDLIRKAIEWKSYLKLGKEGIDRYIVPKALSESQSGWTLTGTESMDEVSLGLEDWNEMQLILPGINHP